MLLEETDKVERFIWGLPDSIQGNITSSKPTRLQEAIEIANSLMDQKVRVYASRQAENKIRMENNSRDNHAQQPPYKRHNVARAYTAGPGEKKEYAGTLPLCNKYKLHHNWSCIIKNQTRNGEAQGRVYALGGGQADQDPNNIADYIDA
nr:reverse transcriptase domain-containing protein [Tanacetum cinerariifolium]